MPFAWAERTAGGIRHRGCLLTTYYRTRRAAGETGARHPHHRRLTGDLASRSRPTVCSLQPGLAADERLAPRRSTRSQAATPQLQRLARAYGEARVRALDANFVIVVPAQIGSPRRTGSTRSRGARPCVPDRDLRAVRRRPGRHRGVAASLSEERGTLEEVVESLLLQAGLSARTPRGRVATCS